MAAMYYSEILPHAVGEETRLIKAKQVHTVLAKHLADRETRDMVMLDYGSSTGLISAYFAQHFRRVVGVDVDRAAIAAATARFRFPNITFMAIASEQTMFRDASFDVVLAHQVYNCVENQTDMFAEIHRILKPGGVCYLSARSKYALIERQYNLPLLSMLPAGAAKVYLKLFRGTSDFIGSRYLSHSGIRKLVARFKIHDYTIAILKRPAEFGFDSLVRYAAIANILPLKSLANLIPNYIMILEKT